MIPETADYDNSRSSSSADSHMCTANSSSSSLRQFKSSETRSFANLMEWRDPNDSSLRWENVRVRWEPYVQAFHEAGYDLFKPVGTTALLFTPDGVNFVERPSDAYHKTTRPKQESHMCVVYRKHFPAVRRTDGIWVLIQIVVLKEDGINELDVLRHLQSYRTDPSNHTLQILDEIQIDDKFFIILPLISETQLSPYSFHTIAEVLDVIHQILEGFNFLHEHRIAHRDIGNTDILHDHIAPCAPYYWTLNPGRIFIIDFQFSIRFKSDTPIHDCLVKGFPFDRYNLYSPEQYGKPVPPEFRSSEPFCPFKADVFQLGKVIGEFLEVQEEFKVNGLAALHDILLKMTDENPTRRPTLKIALQEYKLFQSTVPRAILQQDLNCDKR